MLGANRQTPVVDPHKCHACRVCAARKTCRLKALVQIEANEMPYIDAARCRGCAVCAIACPFGAIVAEK